eukprot:TRINITY_DN8835_c0_g1_i1.p1 TRINITY_DN8835_c0_g1~~TRINITY_DN8835_c0_g1_i1.p1  ORF type:complete len:313 (-),score=27.77 TRINITY_DN8835_c0_g1_i1:357-1253(-)
MRVCFRRNLCRCQSWLVIKQVRCAASQPQQTGKQQSVGSKTQPTQNKKESRPKKKEPQPHQFVTPPNIPVDRKVWTNACILIDKPLDWTSMDVCAKLRKETRVKKVGHAGTLDPLATGLLIVLTGQGTKQVDKYMDMVKQYKGQFCLGEGTPSFDRGTEVDEKLPWEHITDEQVQEALPQFIGEIKQIPPMYSAIKMKGKKLYEMARKGVVADDLPPRDVSVLKFSVNRVQGQIFEYDVLVSKGTYVRSLMHDLGRALGSVAHVTELRRVKIGDFMVDNAWNLEELVEQIYTQRDSLP